MNSTHSKGVLGELLYTAHLIEKGFTVLSPVNPNSSYDLAIEDTRGNFSRIQVKYLTPKHGRLRVELDRPKRKTKTYMERGVDAMGIYDSTNKKFFLIPITKVKNKSEIWLRVNKPKNGQIKNINLAKQFEI
jgi:hypothetical protein